MTDPTGLTNIPCTAKGKSTVPPLLKWAGGKRWLVPILRGLWEPHRHRRLVEPFCGGLAVAIGLKPKDAVLSDINPHAINLYRWVQRGFRIQLEMKNDRTEYYNCRNRFNRLIAEDRWESQEGAELFYYLNRTGYNGLCRFNRNGQYNVPFGRYQTIRYCYDFSAYREIFNRWAFRCGDFETLCVTPDDFIYADPPYDVPFTAYTKEGFSWDDQVRLAEWLSRHSGPVLVSNQATGRIVRLYQKCGFTIHILDAPRRISSSGNRTPAQEILALRNQHPNFG